MNLALLLLFLQIIPISRFLSYAEVTKTSVGAGSTAGASVNKPDARQLVLLQRFGQQYFDPLRLYVGFPLYPSSVFRSEAVNKKVGGAKNSEHMIKDDVVACDIDQDGRGKIGNTALFYVIKARGGYRKLIWEFGTPPKLSGPKGKPDWVHVSWSPDPAKNVEKVYVAVKVGKRTIYYLFDQYVTS